MEKSSNALIGERLKQGQKMRITGQGLKGQAK